MPFGKLILSEYSEVGKDWWVEIMALIGELQAVLCSFLALD